MNATTTRVLIVGGTGFVGETVRRVVRDAGYSVRLLVRSSADAERYQDQGYETEFGNIEDPQSLYIALQGVDAAINLVAIIKESGEATFERINFQGTVNLVNAMHQGHVERLVQMSALGAGNLPGFPYHYTKWRAETYVQDHVPRWTIIRPSIVYGPSAEGHFQFVGQLADLLRSGPVVPVPGKGEARFQPIHVEDVASAFRVALDEEETQQRIIEIGGPEVFTYRQMLDILADQLDIHKRTVNVPVPLIRFGARLLDVAPFVDAPVTTEQLDMLQIDNTTDANAIASLLGEQPKTFRENLGFLRAAN